MIWGGRRPSKTTYPVAGQSFSVSSVPFRDLTPLTIYDAPTLSEKDPLQPSTWQSLTGKQSPSDWGEATARRLANDEEIANTMRHSGICVFEADWAGEVVSERCVFIAITGRVHC